MVRKYFHHLPLLQELIKAMFIFYFLLGCNSPKKCEILVAKPQFWSWVLNFGGGADTFGWKVEHWACAGGAHEGLHLKMHLKLKLLSKMPLKLKLLSNLPLQTAALDPQEGNRHLMIYCRLKFILLPDRKTLASAKGPIQRELTPLTAIFHPLFHISSKFTFSLGLTSSIFSVLKVTSVSPAPWVQ